MNEIESRIVALNSGYLSCPEALPRAWSEMTPSEQAMTIWFVKGRSVFYVDKIARHVVACAIDKNGGTITASEAARLWGLFH